MTCAACRDEQLLEAEAGIGVLAGGDPRADRRRRLGHPRLGVGVVGRDRLLAEERLVGLHRLDRLDRGPDREAAVALDRGCRRPGPTASRTVSTAVAGRRRSVRLISRPPAPKGSNFSARIAERQHLAHALAEPRAGR